VKAHAVEKYSGDPGPPSALQWCRAARIVISSQGSPDEIEMLHTAGAALTGAALTWYTHLFETHEGPPFTTWKEFETALTARFQGQQPMEVAYEDLYRLRQMLGETVRAFDARLVNVYQDLEYAGGERSERTKLQDFQEKLLPEYRQELTRMVALQRGSDPTYQLTKPAALAFLHTFMVSPPVPPQRLGYTSAPAEMLNELHVSARSPAPRRNGRPPYPASVASTALGAKATRATIAENHGTAVTAVVSPSALPTLLLRSRMGRRLMLLRRRGSFLVCSWDWRRLTLLWRRGSVHTMLQFFLRDA